MAPRMILRDGEVRIITVTPVARGTVRPCLAAIVMVALVVVGAKHVHLIHEHEMVLGLIFAGPFGLVALTRTWRWRSHKVHVTNERIVVEGGVLHHQRSTVDLRDVIALRVDQRVTERLARRGVVVLETNAGSVMIGKLRHPERSFDSLTPSGPTVNSTRRPTTPSSATKIPSRSTTKCALGVATIHPLNELTNLQVP